jgi:hypothetical protein
MTLESKLVQTITQFEEEYRAITSLDDERRRRILANRLREVVDTHVDRLATEISDTAVSDVVWVVVKALMVRLSLTEAAFPLGELHDADAATISLKTTDDAITITLNV